MDVDDLRRVLHCWSVDRILDSSDVEGGEEGEEENLMSK